METTRYGWNGWKMPLLHPHDPEYCESGCPLCTRARQGNRLARVFQAVELALTFGGCWWGRARKKKYGVGPAQPLSATEVKHG